MPHCPESKSSLVSSQEGKQSKHMLPRVVIVGGGFGGLYAARELRNAPAHVTLVDKRNYHLFRPMLYQVASGLLSQDEIAMPLRSIFSRQRNVDVFMDEVVGIDAVKRRGPPARCDIAYDYLILSTGIHYNYFGHDEWRSSPSPSNRLSARKSFAPRCSGRSRKPRKWPPPESISCGDSAPAHFCFGRRGDRGRRNGRHTRGNVSYVVKAGLPLYRSAFGTHPSLRGRSARSSHLSPTSFSSKRSGIFEPLASRFIQTPGSQRSIARTSLPMKGVSSPRL